MLKWTRENPTCIGWYWSKKIYPKEVFVDIVYIRKYVDELAIGNWPLQKNDHSSLIRYEWAGPIPLPGRQIKRRKQYVKRGKQ